MEKRSMMVDLEKLARKYPSEVARLREAMEVDKSLKKVRLHFAALTGNLDAKGRLKRPSFDGVPGIPAWKAARILGWRTEVVGVFALIEGLRRLPYEDGRMYYCVEDVKRLASVEKAKAADVPGRLVPTALSLREAAEAMKVTPRVLKQLIRDRRVRAHYRGDEVRIPMCELERLKCVEEAA
ncbi:MAG: hypothetical protein Q8L14_08475 [Myxococcales bacterium]|nr:hypothetical protein [Myxococcales bacterium]